MTVPALPDNTDTLPLQPADSSKMADLEPSNELVRELAGVLTTANSLNVIVDQLKSDTHFFSKPQNENQVASLDD